MPSQAYLRFKLDFLEATSMAQRKDGAPLGLLDALDAGERLMAEEALLQQLSGRNDWPARGLAHLRSQKALPLLRDLLTFSSGRGRASVALAIWQISDDPTMGDELVRLSRQEYINGEKWGDCFILIDVIQCLAQLPYPAVRSRLRELEKNGNPLIAQSASRALGLLPTEHSTDARSLPPP